MNQDERTINELLKVCDLEPIHQLGYIQPHACLLAFSLAGLSVTYYSENLVNVAANHALGEPLREILAGEGIIMTDEQTELLLRFAGDENEIQLFALEVILNDEVHLLLAHKYNGQLIVEIELSDNLSSTHLQQKIGEGVSEVLQSAAVQQKLDNAVKYIKKIIGYERVMVYQFAADGHGEVVAEAKEEDISPLLGLHFPAADIPKQARELYKKNMVRIIADVYADNLRILGIGQDAPLDMTQSHTRAVSPVHIEYLKNMGVRSSFSISLIVNNELWGLIACHNTTKKFIDYKVREASKWLGKILSSSLEYQLNDHQNERKKQVTVEIGKLFQSMQESESIKEGFKKHMELLLSVSEVPGMAVFLENELMLFGITPSEQEIHSIVKFVSGHEENGFFVTNKLSALLPEAEVFSSTASGIMYMNLSKEMGEYILWFRPEISSSVNWAGDPEKLQYSTEAGITKISPRRSFKVWTNEVKSIAKEWGKTETDMAFLIKDYFIRAASQKAYHLMKINERLKESYSELDAFSHTISHDLKTPLMLIRNYAQILQETETNLNNPAIVEKIISGADKMNTLIHDILDYSRAGRFLATKTRIEVKEVLQEISAQLKEIYRAANPEIVILNALPVNGEKTMVWQMFYNLMSNAVKYTSQHRQPKVTVEGKKQKQKVLYTITDNGIGIDPSFKQQMFELFSRSSNAKGFEGTGVGLAIVKRIVDKFEGRIWYESEVGSGTTFYIELPDSEIM